MSEQKKTAAELWKEQFGIVEPVVENKNTPETSETIADETAADASIADTNTTTSNTDAVNAWKEQFGIVDEPKQSEAEQIEETQEDLNKGLSKTKRNFFQKITAAVAGKATVDETALDDIEEALISADVSLDTTIKIIDRLEARVAKDKYLGSNELMSILKAEIVDLLSENNTPDDVGYVLPTGTRPHVVMVVGVNGAGKTTTIGKLAYHFKQQGVKVIIGAADTFRAAAVDQINVWAQRIGVDIVMKKMGSDPSSVVFDTLASAKAKNADLVLIDTAGRLHNKKGLMEELAKIKRVMSKQIPDAPHDVMLVLDGSTGQNALEQAKQFSEFTQVSSLAITKLDGTAKGGVVIAIADQLSIPIKYIGVGEKAQHLQVFNKANFVNTLFE